MVVIFILFFLFSLVIMCNNSFLWIVRMIIIIMLREIENLIRCQNIQLCRLFILLILSCVMFMMMVKLTIIQD